MSTAASENRPFATPTASAVLPMLFLVAIPGGCWAVTVQRMQGMDMGPAPTSEDSAGSPSSGDDDGRDDAPLFSPMALAYSRAAGTGQARSIARTVVFAAGICCPGSRSACSRKGGFCFGCSGALMAALFALGVMSIAWMLLIPALVCGVKRWAVKTLTDPDAKSVNDVSRLAEHASDHRPPETERAPPDLGGRAA